jgi:hypothetical protein
MVFNVALAVRSALAGPRVVDLGRYLGSESFVENLIPWPTPPPQCVGFAFTVRTLCGKVERDRLLSFDFEKSTVVFILPQRSNAR